MLRSSFAQLRRYEVSKLKYYFAVATFTSHDAANVAYKELDGIELEHSSCAIDVRAIPPEAISSVSQNRTIRDSCDAVPATYEAPEFISKALQQSNIECSWEAGDNERANKLTKWGVGTDQWKMMGEGDDLNLYLASESDSSDSDEEGGSGKAAKKMVRRNEK